MGDAEIVQVPGEVRAKLGAVVRFDALDGDGQALADLVDEGDGRLDRVVVVDLQDPVTGGLIDGSKLVVAAGAELEMLDVDLDRLAGHVEFPATLRPTTSRSP